MFSDYPFDRGFVGIGFCKFLVLFHDVFDDMCLRLWLCEVKGCEALDCFEFLFPDEFFDIFYHWFTCSNRGSWVKFRLSGMSPFFTKNSCHESP